MSSDPYSTLVRRLFENPNHAGEVSGGKQVSLEAQGVRVQLSVRPANGGIEALRFRVWGCPHLIAATEAFCEQAAGKPLSALANWSMRELMQTLAVPVEKTGRILVLEDAIHELGNLVGVRHSDM